MHVSADLSLGTGVGASVDADAVRERPHLSWPLPLAVLAVLAASLWVAHHELGGLGLAHLKAAWHSVPSRALANAAGLTVLAYVMLSGYDLLALWEVRGSVRAPQVAFASWLAYAISQTLGFPLLTGGAIRLRFWSAWGLSTSEIASATAFVSTTFMLGVAAMSGLALVAEPSPLLAALHAPLWAARGIGMVMLAGVLAFISWSLMRTDAPLAVGTWRISVPRPRMVAAQLVLALLDWVVAALVLYVLLPGVRPSALAFVGMFALVQAIALVSHVPGGLGVFESLMLVALRDVAPPDQLVAALAAYRVVYYLAPFALGLVTLAALEVGQHRGKVPVLLGTASTTANAVLSGTARVAILLQPLLPTVLGFSTFVGGALLLFSGAMPAAHGRLHAIGSVLPLGLVELSHFTGSLAGVGLMVLGAALRRRLDAAWGATVLLLVLGVGASLLKGLDWEEASLLFVLLLVVVAARRAFYRPTALTADVLTPAWLFAMLAVVGASIWVGLLAYRHMDYSNELWWQFAVRGDVPRFLRASAGAVVAAFTVGAWRLLRPATPDVVLPTAEELEGASRVIHTVPESTAALALLADKQLLFTDDRDAFVMYGVSGRSWISMGDPVGREDHLADAAWRFREAADAHGAWPVFYQVTPRRLPLYIDLGLTLLKLGEEAVVPLTGFSLDGGDRKWMRRALKEGDKAGLVFDVVPREQVPSLFDEVRPISQEWLAHKAAREKGFSLGRYDEAYLRHFPMAVVREVTSTSTRIVAFANVWTGCEGGEIAPDLMRRANDAPKGTMDVLFVELLRWGAAHGYRTANLGMAPLAGLMDPALTRPALAPLWARAGTALYGRGEKFYNFQGVRSFKEKFSPKWEPRYLASPGGIATPRVLANVTALIAGGVAGILPR